MIIKVKVHPGSTREEVRKINDGEFEIWILEKAIGGKANFSLIKILAKEFGVSTGKIKIKTLKGRKKIVEIIE